MKQLQEKEVTLDSLINVFESAFIKTDNKEEESFKIQGEHLNPTVLIDKNRKFVSFRIIYGLTGSISLHESLQLANKVNEEYIFIKLSAIEYEENIYLESRYYMTYEEGLNAFQFINTAKKVEKYTVDALREYFNDYL